MLIDFIHDVMLEDDDFFANMYTNAYFMMTCIFSDAYKPTNLSENIEYLTHALDIRTLCEVSKIAQLQLAEDLKVYEAATEHIYDGQFLRNGNAHVIIKQYIDFKIRNDDEQCIMPEVDYWGGDDSQVDTDSSSNE